MLKLAEIKEMSKEEIRSQLGKSKNELVELRMKFASRQLEDVSQIRKKRKEIARLLTPHTIKLNEKESPALKEEKKSTKLIKPKKVTAAGSHPEPKAKDLKTKKEEKDL